MKKVFVDTNVILDLLAQRDGFYQDSKQIFALADTKRIELWISTLSIANTTYILSDMLKMKNAKQILSQLKTLVQSVSLSDKIVELALSDTKFTDFEDAIQHYSAIDSKCEVLITRNINDFKQASISIMKPNEFLSDFLG